MNQEELRLANYKKTAGTIFVVILFILAFLIVRPFIVAILSAAALSYIFYPLYLALAKKVNLRLASLLTLLVIVLLVLLPTIFLSFVVTYELKSGFLFVRENLQSPQLTIPSLAPYLGQWAEYLPQVKELVSDQAGQLVGVVQGILKGIPDVVVNIIVTIFSIYYFLVHGKDLYNFFSNLVPLPEGRYKQILSRFNDLSRGMILGQVLVGIVQGVLAGLGFWHLQVPNPVLWGCLTAIISMIPLLGAALVWIPIDLYLFIIALNTGDFVRPIILLFYGLLVISLIDNFLKPKIVGDSAKIHPLIVLFGILGGIQLFGIAGILIGPLILTIFDVVIEIYKEII